MKMTKLVLLAVVLFALAMPAASWAAVYDPVYGVDPSSIAWTNESTVSLDGATSAYHAWYDDGTTRVDYYIAYYDTYFNEYLLYNGDGNEQSWGYTSAYDGSYTRVRELIETGDVYLDYAEYNDGSYYYYDLQYDDYANDYFYDEEREVLPSGSYVYWYDYETKNLEWEYDSWYDTSDGTMGLRSWTFDPVNGTEYGQDEWSSTLTSSYSVRTWDRSGTWNDIGYWDFDESANGSSSSYYESFSADYSSFSSSYEQYTYSPDGQAVWRQWDARTTDTSYYETGYSWDDEINGDYTRYAESFSPNGGDRLEKYFQQSHDNTDYSSNYEYYFEEYTGGYLYTWDRWNYDADYTESYYHQRYYDPDNNGDTGEYYDYQWSVDTALYREYSSAYSYDNGYFSNYASTYARDWTGTVGNLEWYGSGYWEEQSSNYDPGTQQTSFNYNYETYAADLYAGQNWGTSVYDYYYSETVLADSDQRNVYWSLYNRDATTGSQTNWQQYSYTLNSDTRNENWYYYYYDYVPTNDTYYYENHWKNLGTGAYEDYSSYQVSGISNQWTETGSDLDYYWSNSGGYDSVAEYNSYYTLLLANGNADFESFYRDKATGDWFDLEANYLTDHWTGRGLQYTDLSGTYDLYLYTNYPGDYFLTLNYDPPSGDLP